MSVCVYVCGGVDCMQWCIMVFDVCVIYFRSVRLEAARELNTGVVCVSVLISVCVYLSKS